MENKTAEKSVAMFANNLPVSTSNSPVTYVVVRDGFRVSDREYNSPTDEEAVVEKKFWAKIAREHSHKERVQIVTYEPSKHRVW